MNIVDPDHGVLGCYGIVGGSIAAATGAALSLRGSGRVAVAYFGDGAINQAYFYECLNFAKVFSLPVVFVCENNGYGEYTPFEAVTPGGIVPRAAALEVPTMQIDGMDIRAVRAAAAEVVERVRTGGGAVLRRGDHVPLRRPLAQRPGQVPAGGRARPLARARPARASPRPSWASPASSASVAQIEADVTAELERIEARSARGAVPGRSSRSRSSTTDERRDRRRDRHAEALRLDGGGDGARLAEAARRRGRARRAARRGRDRQGDDRLRGRGRRRARRDPRRRRRDRGARRADRAARTTGRSACRSRSRTRRAAADARGAASASFAAREGWPCARDARGPAARAGARRLARRRRGLGPGRAHRQRRRAGGCIANGRPGRGATTEVTPTATQRTIAQRMAASRASIPEFTLEAEIAMEAAGRLREELRSAEIDPLPSFNDFVLRAVALATARVPGAERDVRGRPSAAARPRQRRHRRRRRRRADRPDGARRRRASRSSRSRASHARWRTARAAARSRRSSWPTARSPSRTSACSACAASTRSSTRRRPRSSPSARSPSAPSSRTAPSSRA